MQTTATDCLDLREIGRGVTCWIVIGPKHDPEWTGQATGVPLEWVGHDVAGSLHIIDNWGTPSAEFTADNTTVLVRGGKPDHQHFFPA